MEIGMLVPGSISTWQWVVDKVVVWKKERKEGINLKG